MNKYSIILPVRNGGELVKLCVNSILSQEYLHFDLIILDNNSNDGTAEWLSTLVDKRITVIPSDASLSIGQNWARIKSVQKNEFITLIGHDDLLHPNYLGEMDALIARHPTAGLYQTHFTFIDSHGDHVRYCMPMDEVQYGHEFLACQLARTMDSMGTGYMMRSRDYDSLGGIDENYPNLIFADYELWVKLSLLSYKATSDKVCFEYRLHNSTSKNPNGEAYRLAFEKYIYFLADLSGTNPKIKQVIDRYGHDMLLYFCESLSHRLLKTPVASREVKVQEFIEKCREYASILVPGKKFEPNKKFRINIAAKIDKNPVTRLAFDLFKKLTS